MGRRIDIQADDVGEFLREGRVVREFEVPPAMRAEAVGLPDRLHRRGRNAGDLRHRAQRPMGRLVRRRLLRQANDLGDAFRWDGRLAGWARPVAKQTVNARLHEPLLPAPDAGLGLGRSSHDRRGPQTLAAQKHDASPPDVLLRALGISDDRPQSFTIAGGYREGNAVAHAADSHAKTQSGIPIRTPLIRSIH